MAVPVADVTEPGMGNPCQCLVKDLLSGFLVAAPREAGCVGIYDLDGIFYENCSLRPTTQLEDRRSQEARRPL